MTLIGRSLLVCILSIILFSITFIPYSMAEDDYECYGFTYDDEDVCNGKGDCKDEDQCECYSGYLGVQCEYWQCFGKVPEDPMVCNNNGICVGPDQCQCFGSYSGPDCIQVSY